MKILQYKSTGSHLERRLNIPELYIYDIRSRYIATTTKLIVVLQISDVINLWWAVYSDVTHRWLLTR